MTTGEPFVNDRTSPLKLLLLLTILSNWIRLFDWKQETERVRRNWVGSVFPSGSRQTCKRLRSRILNLYHLPFSLLWRNARKRKRRKRLAEKKNEEKKKIARPSCIISIPSYEVDPIGPVIPSGESICSKIISWDNIVVLTTCRRGRSTIT